MQKYFAELNKALDKYTELIAQTTDFDPMALYEVRQAVRPAQEKAVENSWRMPCRRSHSSVC